MHSWKCRSGLAGALLIALAAGVRAQSGSIVTVEFQPITVPAGHTSRALAINETGAVVGATVSVDNLARGFGWTPAGLVEVPPLAGDVHSVALLINNAGQVFGVSQADFESNRMDRLIVWIGGMAGSEPAADPARSHRRNRRSGFGSRGERTD